MGDQEKKVSEVDVEVLIERFNRSKGMALLSSEDRDFILSRMRAGDEILIKDITLALDDQDKLYVFLNTKIVEGLQETVELVVIETKRANNLNAIRANEALAEPDSTVAANRLLN